MKPEELCNLLHIGRNTYGRWERGEVEITPSMNLLVHGLMEKMPGVREKVLGDESEKEAALTRRQRGKWKGDDA